MVMPSSDSSLIAGHERHILAQLIADDEMHETGLDGHVGPYHLVECLGEGGFGFVWRAEQTEPVRREVALKVLKRGMDTAQVLARFSLEQQALASMEHPHIAALLDAGATHDGRPFFAMELVRGPAVTRYCQEKALPWPERVALFRDICGGVQHAHQKGMIHRDLKPSNILVAEVDGRPVPKIIDFGIAKAMTGLATHQTLITRAGYVMGTPLYMSPEQLGGGKDVDIRSDVYSLGVLFYEMLSGTLPFQGHVQETTTVTEMLRIVSERSPVRPSARMTEAVQGKAGPDACGRQARVKAAGVPVDLDWIILKALENDRERRYDSVGALMADLDRFLNNEAVLARPPSFQYLAGRWIRRHRVAFAAASVSLGAILAGTAMALWQAHEARVAQRLAEQESRRAIQAVSFLTAMLDRVAAEIANGRNPEALKLALENSRETIEAMDHDPALQAELFRRVSWLYEAMGERKLALPLLKAHLDAMTRLKGAENPQVWEIELTYITKVIDHGTRNTGPVLLDDLLRKMDAQNARYSPLGFMVKRQVVRCWTKLDQPRRAAEEARLVLKELAGHAVPPSTELGVKAACLDALREARAHDEASRLAKETLEICKREPDLHERIGWIEGKWMEIMRDSGEGDQVVRFLTERAQALAADSKADTKAWIEALLALAEAESQQKSLDAAIRHAAQAGEIAGKRAPTPDELNASGGLQTMRDLQARSLCELAGYESHAGHHQEAILHARESFRIADEQGHLARVADALQVLAEAQERAGDHEGAFNTYKLRGERTGQRGANYLRWHEDLESMCEIRLRQGRAGEALQLAIELWQKEVSGQEASQDPQHLARLARLALRCHTEWLAGKPSAPPPAELAAWKAAIKR